MAKTIQTFSKDQTDLPIGDRINLAYASTIVTKGRGTGVTVGTAMNTQVSLSLDIGSRWVYAFSRSGVSQLLLDQRMQEINSKSTLDPLSLDLWTKLQLFCTPTIRENHY